MTEQTERRNALNVNFVFYKHRQCDDFIPIINVVVLFLGGISSFSDPARPRDYYSGEYSHPFTKIFILSLKTIFADDRKPLEILVK